MPDRPSFAFITEHTVGHVTFERVLRAAVAADGGIDAAWLPLEFPPHGPLEALPPLRANWSLRSSLRARAALAREPREWDALLFHTQTASLLSTGVMRRVPTAISVDATPRNLDEVATGYGHRVGPPAVERVKAAIVGRPLRAARAVIAWSEWVRTSLIADYGVDPQRIHVVPAGTRIPRPAPTRTPDDALHLLFVGGDFARKGGPTLLDALARADFPWTLDVVTQSSLEPPPGVTVHRDVRPGSPLLDDLYARSDAFVLPSSADASPHVILEAMAFGLPVVSTPIGAIPELVADGTGALVAPRDAAALRAAIACLRDVERRTAMGARARARAEQRFDAAENARRVLGVLRAISGP